MNQNLHKILQEDYTWRRTLNCHLILITLGVAIFVLSLSGCTGDKFVAGKVEKGLEKRLPQIIGPAESYDVHVNGRAFSMMSGKIAEITIRGKKVQLQPDLSVDDLLVNMREVEVDTEKNQLTQAGETRFQATLSDQVLTSYITKKQPDLKQLKISTSRGKMTIQTRPSVLGLSAGVSLTGSLELGSANKVDFRPDTASVAGLHVPGMVVDFIMNRVNPIMDLSLARFPAQITGMTVLTKAIRVTGTADLNQGLGNSRS